MGEREVDKEWCGAEGGPVLVTGQHYNKLCSGSPLPQKGLVFTRAPLAPSHPLTWAEGEEG